LSPFRRTGRVWVSNDAQVDPKMPQLGSAPTVGRRDSRSDYIFSSFANLDVLEKPRQLTRICINGHGNADACLSNKKKKIIIEMQRARNSNIANSPPHHLK
jgi:hypothetical protein